MKKTALAALCIFLLLSLSTCTSSAPAAQDDASSGTQQVSGSPFFTGDGGRGSSIAILAPKATGLPENQDYIPHWCRGNLSVIFPGSQPYQFWTASGLTTSTPNSCPATILKMPGKVGI
ncbi:hypothetical protein K7I13_07095 [Brucepastera parasyntrophica]|uniref:hypothetical protein n=1 Tax=Brucepastera parasyntrophica TaxID=2880008 RepID=UPI00210E6D89|nr:hypothetical protein [Brucepastera parasyntrophica]ULQ61011.1 hypothetical protein K7I13_07095 [Brucepastera parasyntrophica]